MTIPALIATGREKRGRRGLPMTEPYCDRCGDTGVVSVERIGIQPEAVRCSCYLVNPVIKERHRRLDEGKANRVRGGGYGSSLED